MDKSRDKLECKNLRPSRGPEEQGQYPEFTFKVMRVDRAGLSPCSLEGQFVALEVGHYYVDDFPQGNIRVSLISQSSVPALRGWFLLQGLSFHVTAISSGGSRKMSNNGLPVFFYAFSSFLPSRIL